jgi:hypothetical protein
MIVVATNVNKFSVVDADWSTTKSLTATMNASATHTTATSSIPITVVPCAITAVAITKV